MNDSDPELEQYLREFETILGFDAETCPKCGLDFTKDQIAIAKWVELKTDLQLEHLNNTADLLEENGIHYYFRESGKSKSDCKLYTLLVLNDSVTRSKELLKI